MSLFVIQHKHAPETCPAGHPEMGPALVQHVSPQNAARFGITVRGDAVINGQHTFYLILDAVDEGKVREFMAPFAQAGPVEIMPASSCELVVERGRC
jgi:hypothetical protein